MDTLVMTWPLCALILGLAFVLALWDGARRYASAKGIEARVTAVLDKRLADHREHIDTIKRGTDAYVQQTTAEIQALRSGLAVRQARA